METCTPAARGSLVHSNHTVEGTQVPRDEQRVTGPSDGTSLSPRKQGHPDAGCTTSLEDLLPRKQVAEGQILYDFAYLKELKGANPRRKRRRAGAWGGRGERGPGCRTRGQENDGILKAAGGDDSPIVRAYS